MEDKNWNKDQKNNKYKTVTNIVDINPTILLNNNSLNVPIERQRLLG